MRLAKGLWTACVLALALNTQCGSAQTLAQAVPETTPQSTQDALHTMAQVADVIFAGQVTAVRARDGAIEIDFAVDDAVRGVIGSNYTLREWTGLWPAGDQPFRVGQRYLMLLHAPGASGLSSPVGGMDGAIPIRGSVQIAGVQAANTTSLSALIATQSIDLRWIATRVVQPLAYQTIFVVRPTSLPSPVHPNVIAVASFTGETPALSDTGDAATPALYKPAHYSTVMAMLRGWERDDHAAR